MVFADGPGTWVETTIVATPSAVWPVVTDINLPAEFSEEFLGAEWNSPGPALGASFTGRNKHDAVGEWQTESFVDEFEVERVFGWAVSDVDNPGARWRFRLNPSDEGVVLRFEVSLGPGSSGTTMAIEARPDKEDRIIRRRIGELNANMHLTIEGIRQTIEHQREV